MTSHHVRAARRNFSVVGATAVTVGALFLFPTSTNRTGQHAVAVPVRTVIGQPVETRYGPVRVQVRLRGSRIISATATAYPQATPGLRAINGHAIPLLQKETLAAQSARIDSVSGATYTSQAYVGSLQSALDAAHR